MSQALQRRENVAGYLFMLPSLIFFLGFVIIPMFICIITSLTNTNMHQEGMFGSFIGLKNFTDLAKDKVFLKGLANTFTIVIVSVPAVCAFSLWVSSAIYKLRAPCCPPSAASSTCPSSPAPWPSPWYGNGYTITTTAF